MIQAVFNHLWQTTLFAAAAGLLTLALRKNSARVRHWIWLAASLKFLVPFSLPIDLGSHLGIRRTTVPSRTSTMIQQVSRPFAPAADPFRAAPLKAKPAKYTPILFGMIWGAGFTCVIVYWSRRWLRMYADVRRAAPLDLGLAIPVKSSPALREPGVFGFFRPVLLLPAGITERLDPEQLQTIVVHELCHVRRRDNLWSAIHMLVEACFWFYPLVWWLGARLIEERERACDEAVIEQGAAPEMYAEAILKVCKLYVGPPLALVAGVGQGNLKTRIERIMLIRSGEAARKLDLVKKAMLTIAGIAAVACPVGVGVLNAPRTFAQTNTSQYTFGLTTVAEKAFEVASIKPGPPGEDGWQLGVPTHGGITIDNMELRKIVASSFRIQDSMVVGPGWIDSARYTIVAKGPDPSVGNPVVWEMLRHLLAERFQLKYHVEARQRPIYALVVAKGGHKLKLPEDGVCAEAIKRNEHCANLRFGLTFLGITNMPVQALIGGMGRIMPDRPIVDKTGVTGFYDVDVKWEQPPADGLAPHVDTAAMNIALEEQAGLKLESQTGPVDFLVIDRVEKPSEN
jgi:bla regulator protein blaR1